MITRLVSFHSVINSVAYTPGADRSADISPDAGCIKICSTADLNLIFPSSHPPSLGSSTLDRDQIRHRPSRRIQTGSLIHEGYTRHAAVRLLTSDHPGLGTARSRPAKIRGLQRPRGSGVKIWYVGSRLPIWLVHGIGSDVCRHQGVFRLAYDTAVVRRQGIRRRLRHPHVDASERGALQVAGGERRARPCGICDEG